VQAPLTMNSFSGLAMALPAQQNNGRIPLQAATDVLWRCY